MYFEVQVPYMKWWSALHPALIMVIVCVIVLLKAAALIAYHQPMHQSRLVELLGQKAYDYVRELAQYGMIQRRKEGNTRRLTTTRRFSEAFGCPHTDLRKVRKWFREQVTDAGLFDGMQEVDALQEVGEDGLIQATLPLEEE